MPFQIIRNDITKVHADAIVNTANPRPFIGDGTDRAVYEAAGADELLAERKKIGDIAPGQAEATPAFRLSAKYIIHTVGPVWNDGSSGEENTLRACYRNSLVLAMKMGCNSIAFPLISTGVYGFPNDKALTIALSEISQFLLQHEMDVCLVVFDNNSFQLSKRLFSDIRAFVDENYVDEYQQTEYRKDNLERFDQTKISWQRREQERKASERTLTADLHVAFRDRLFELIEESHFKKDSDVYKAAGVTKKVFSDIRRKKDYQPSKRTAVGFAIALKLSQEETEDLLARAGIVLTNTNKFDIVIKYCISHGIYNMDEINLALYNEGQEGIGVVK